MYLAVQNLTQLFSLIVPKFVVFFRLMDRKFNKDSKNMLKTVIFSLQVDLTSNFVPDCHTVLKSCKNQGYKSFLAVFNTKLILRCRTVTLTVVT